MAMNKHKFNAGSKNGMIALAIILVIGIATHWLTWNYVIYANLDITIENCNRLQVPLIWPALISAGVFAMMYWLYYHATAKMEKLAELKASLAWLLFLALAVVLNIGVIAVYAFTFGSSVFTAMPTATINAYVMTAALNLLIDVVVFVLCALFLKPECIQNGM